MSFISSNSTPAKIIVDKVLRYAVNWIQVENNLGLYFCPSVTEGCKWEVKEKMTNAEAIVIKEANRRLTMAADSINSPHRDKEYTLKLLGEVNDLLALLIDKHKREAQ